MTFMFRHGLETDVENCIRLLKEEDCFRASDRVWKSMASCWKSGIATESLHFTVYEDITPHEDSVLQGFSMSVAISEEFVQQLRGGSSAFGACKVYGSHSFNTDLVLTRREIARANGGDGINLLLLHNPLKHRMPSDPKFTAMLSTALAGFNFAHGGYNLKSILWEVHGLHFVGALASIGYRLLDNFVNLSDVQRISESKRPFLMGLFRESVLSLAYSAETLVLNANKPILGFTPSQQRVLRHALMELDDRELSDLLDVSLSSIKQSWKGIFGKAKLRFPDAFGDSAGDTKRLFSPRRAVLNYARQHLEELRPYEERIQH
jgi:hypothetical protein